MDAIRHTTLSRRPATRLLGALAALGCMWPAVIARGDGACCMEDGSCQQMTHLNCYIAGGKYAGNGSNCLEIDCSGACCLPDGSCDMMSQLACEDSGGNYRGNGVDCESVVCNLAGACCLGDAGCVADTTFLYCQNTLEGTWMGYGTTCNGPDAAWCRGACCLDDGSCTDSRSAADCLADGGQFNDFGTHCSINGRCSLEEEATSNVQVQRVPFSFVMINNADRTFTFDKFDDDGGNRVLHSVSVEINGHLMLVAVLRNSGDVPIDLDQAVRISEDLSVRFSENVDGLPVSLTSVWTPALPFEDLVLLGEEGDLLAPGQSTAFQSPYKFASELAGGAGNDMFVVRPDQFRLDLSAFVAEPEDSMFFVTLRGHSSIDTNLQGQGTLMHSPHRAMGFIRVRYEYSVNAQQGACCLTNGSCAGTMTRAACENLTNYMIWTQGMSCADGDRICRVEGMCCLDDESCVDQIFEDACVAMPGSVNWTPLGHMRQPGSLRAAWVCAACATASAMTTSRWRSVWKPPVGPQLRSSMWT